MNTTIAELAKEIAQHLEGWEAAENDADNIYHGDDNGRLTHESGAEIHLRRIWNHQERVEISGSYPRSANGKCYPADDCRARGAPEITCAIGREAGAIAGDITKRFLPNYLWLYGWAKERLAEYESDRVSEAALMKRLGQVCGIPAGINFRGNAKIYGDCGPVWVGIKPYGDNTVEMSLRSVPADFAEKICELLALLQEPKEA